jgi:hypothetical protein
MGSIQPWCRITLAGIDGSVFASWVLEGQGSPDLGTVDGLARLKLLMGRIGGSVTLTELSPSLQDLLDLTGIGVEMEGQSEFGEETLGVQLSDEELHPGDPSA